MAGTSPAVTTRKRQRKPLSASYAAAKKRLNLARLGDVGGVRLRLVRGCRRGGLGLLLGSRSGDDAVGKTGRSAHRRRSQRVAQRLRLIKERPRLARTSQQRLGGQTPIL